MSSNSNKGHSTIDSDTLDSLTEDELVTLGTKLDGVTVIFRKERFPEPGTKAEARANRQVTFWVLLGTIASIALFVSYIWWPHQYRGPGDSGYLSYILYTPILGLTLGIAFLSIGIAVILFVKKFIPEEIAVQERHDGGSAKIDKKTTAALFKNALTSSTLPRRKLIKGSLFSFLGTFSIAGISVALGGLIKNPWSKAEGKILLHSGWTPVTPDEVIFLRRYTGDPYDVVLVRPEELQAGAMETVFPWRITDGYGDTHESQEKLLQATKAVRNPVMLMRFHPEDTARAIKRKGQENFNYGDYWAYTKVCSHLGCPTSLFEQQTHHILCPCHQSQFDALQWGKPIFGPAARPLAQLPITVNSQGYLVAAGDFIEPVGPAFWERKS